MHRLSLALATTMLFASCIVNAALPPLSQEEREAMASDIVSGVVISTSSEVVETMDGFSDSVYHVTLIVTEVVKSESLTPGEVIEITYWRAHTRPNGWCGPNGQYGEIENYSSIRAYMTMGADGVYSLLQPNGFDRE